MYPVRKRRRMNPPELISNQTEVSLIITKHLFSKKEFKNNNIVFSPLLLQVVLSILAAGSKGRTKRQLLSFLRSKSTKHLRSLASRLTSYVLSDAAPAGGPRLSFANGLWFQKYFPLQSSFKQLLTAHYKATLDSVDFRTRGIEATMNLWAETETNGLIKDLLPSGSVNSLTQFIFANALYFKGAWYEKFVASKTKDYDFHLLDGSSVTVPFMTSKKKQCISAFRGFKVLRLPYEQGIDKRQFSMYFFLPNAKDGLSALVEHVASDSGFLECKLPFEKVEVGDFRVPRFKISFGLETSDVLKELGVFFPFSSGDLTKILESNGSHQLYVSKIFHKSFIEVKEEGVEAAAASAKVAMLACKPRTSTRTRINFVADHPFLFLIREDLSRTILFLGQVLNPLTE